MYNKNNIFAKILRNEIPCVKVYEDENSHGFIVINGSYHLYNDTLFTNFGSWVSGGVCKKK